MLKLITTAFGQKNTVLVTNTRSPLGGEILRQLSQYPYIEIKNYPDASQELPSLELVSTIIHLPSNAPDLLAEIVGNTSTLYRLLTLAKSNHAKFVLVVPSIKTSLYQTAMQMVVQFGKNYQLPYNVFEAPPSAEVEATAEAILKKIIFNHKNIPAQKIIEQPKIEPKKTNSKREFHVPKFSLPQIALPSFTAPKMPVLHLPKGSGRWVFLFTAILITPWTLFIIANASLILASICSFKSLQTNHISRAASCAQSARFLQTGSRLSSMLAIGARPLIAWAGYPTAETTDLISSAADSLSLAASIDTQASQYVQNLLGSKEYSNLASSADLKINLTKLSESLANLQNNARSFYAASPRPPEQLNELAKKVIQLREISSNAQAAIGDILPILETSSSKKIAILLQDNTELRPSGGYLDSILLLTVENTKITGWRVITTQVADQQLLGSVDTPADFKVATGQLQWYLRDSNWDIDFRKSASKAAWFIQKELNETPDIVISTNLSTLGQVVNAIGSIKIGLSGVTILDTNIQSEYHNYLKSHADNNDFIKTITEKILERTKTLNTTDQKHITSILINELNAHQIYVAVPDRPTAGLDQAGWSGGVTLPKCRSALLCIVDMVGVVDSNIGINKTDAYTEKKWTTEMNVSQTGVQTVLTGEYKNTSSENAWPAGVYKNYLRLILPPSSLVESVKIGDRELKKTEITITNENGLEVMGFKFEVLPGQASTISVTTSQNMPIVPGRMHYQLNILPQSGRKIETQRLIIKYPPSWFATSYQQPGFASAGELEYNLGAQSQGVVDIDFAITK